LMCLNMLNNTDKKQIANCFNRASKVYLQNADLQRRVSDLLFDNIKNLPLANKHLVDVGSGIGIDCLKLRNQFAGSQVISLDIAHKMLKCSVYLTADHARITTICADFETLPFRKGAVDFIYANMSLQWSLDLVQTLQEFRRVLSCQGFIAFSIPIQGTFSELIAIQKGLDKYRYNEFHSAFSVKDHIEQVGFTCCFLKIYTQTLYFTDPSQLIQSIRNTGAQHIKGNVMPGFDRGYYKYLQSELENKRKNQGIPLTYQILYGLIAR
jgi:malonyl-CoA O-methyltransferase